MDYDKLKKAVRNIDMPEEMKVRIIENCNSENTYKTEETAMNKNNTKSRFKRPAAVALAAALFICFALGAAAAGRSGFFSDIIKWDGAVVDTQYENATNEIDAKVISADNGVITVSAVLLKPDSAPYSEIENLSISSYEIIDTEGNVVIKGESAEFADIIGSKAEIKISAECIAEGEYRLIISSFVGGSKADRPLNIYGEWECEFTA